MIGQHDAILRLESLGCEVWLDRTFGVMYWGKASGPGPGDPDVVAIRELAPLSSLSLRSSLITDDGLEELTARSELRHLSLDCCDITDRGLAFIGQMEQLEVLSLTDTRVTDDGLRHLADLSALHTLKLDGTDIAGRGLVALRKLTTLRDLDLSRTQCGDSSVPDVLSLPCVEKLRWNHSPLTDDGARQLVSLRKVRLLELRGVALSPSFAAWLTKSMRHCEIRLASRR